MSSIRKRDYLAFLDVDAFALTCLAFDVCST